MSNKEDNTCVTGITQYQVESTIENIEYRCLWCSGKGRLLLAGRKSGKAS